MARNYTLEPVGRESIASGPPELKKKSDCFWMPGSPLHGKKVPPAWDRLDLNGKKQVLVERGFASDWSSASSLLGKHAASVRKFRAWKRNGGKGIYLEDM
jgi:hypothetical protein